MSWAFVVALSLASPSADLAAAQNQLLEGRPEEAALLYRSVVEAGHGSADVHYNLGVAEHKAGNTTQAILHFEKSLRQEPGAADTLANLGALRDESEPSFFFADKLEPWLAPMPADLATWLFLGLQAGFVLSLAFWVGRRERAGGSAALVLSGVLLLLSLAAGAALASHAYVASDPRAVVMKGVRLEEGPDARFDDGAQVKAGARVRVSQENGAWEQVQLRDGTTGWLKKDKVQEI